jgi:hypothetical protein
MLSAGNDLAALDCGGRASEVGVLWRQHRPIRVDKRDFEEYNSRQAYKVSSSRTEKLEL